MASRNYHKNRTKERKRRQAAQRAKEEAEHRAVLRRCRAAPLMGPTLALFAAADAPKMFVRDGKLVPFKYL